MPLDRPRKDVEFVSPVIGPWDGTLRGELLFRDTIQDEVAALIAATSSEGALTVSLSSVDDYLRIFEAIQSRFSLGVDFFLHSPGGLGAQRAEISRVIAQVGRENTTAYVPFVAQSIAAEVALESGFRILGQDAELAIHAPMQVLVPRGATLVDINRTRSFLPTVVRPEDLEEYQVLLEQLKREAKPAGRSWLERKWAEAQRQTAQKPDLPISGSAREWATALPNTTVMPTKKIKEHLNERCFGEKEVQAEMWNGVQDTMRR